MSHFRIQRKRSNSPATKISNSPATKIKSEESKTLELRSNHRIFLNETAINLVKKRITARQISEQSHHILRSKKGKSIEKIELAVGYDFQMDEGVKAYREKDLKKALKIFKQLYKSNQKSAELAYYIGSCQLNQNHHQTSIFYLNNCLLLNPQYHQNVYLYIAINFKKLTNIKQALNVLKDGLHHFPAFQEGLFYLGKLHMKIQQYEASIQCFNKCLEINHQNQLAYIFLAESFTHLDKISLALQKYDHIIEKGRKHKSLAILKKVYLLIHINKFKQANELLEELMQKQKEHGELYYLKGLILYYLNEKYKSIIFLETCLSHSKDLLIAAKAIILLIQISIQDCDFFGAQHLISRAFKIGIKEQYLLEWKLLIYAINDMIKRTNETALQQIIQVVHLLQQKESHRLWTQKQCLDFKIILYPFYSYCLFVNKKLNQALEVYKSMLTFHQEKSAIHLEDIHYNLQDIYYNLYICQGCVFHQNLKFQQSLICFERAYEIKKKPEALLMACINLVQSSKVHKDNKDEIFDKVQKYLGLMGPFETRNSLIFFYHSLVSLFLGRPSFHLINLAIDTCDQPISQYYFIKALILSTQGQLTQGLEMISKALEIDENISQFYKERSKYLFLLEDYENAIGDCIKANQLSEDDEEIKLLLTFYYYLNNNYELCWEELKGIVGKDTSSKYVEFQQALMLRLGFYDELGVIGVFLKKIHDEKVDVSLSDVLQMQTLISKREQYSEFSVYFFHLILANYYTYGNQSTKALGHFFGCLEEIQIIIDQKELLASSSQASIISDHRKSKLSDHRASKPSDHRASKPITFQETQNMLLQIKFNIVIASLCKNNLEEVENFILVFVKETQNSEMKCAFQQILKVIRKQQKKKEINIFVFERQYKLSERFPVLTLIVHETYTINTKMLFFYPIKLKFSIYPEFDANYLYNFDLEKVQHKLIVPWLKLKDQAVFFTENIRNQQLVLSETERSESMLRSVCKTPIQFNFKDQFKLDEKVQAKLKKLIKK